MRGRRGRRYSSSGARAGSVGLLILCATLAACSAPAGPPVEIVSVERLPQERVLYTDPVLVKEVIYRFGIRAEDFPRLNAGFSDLNFHTFRCERPGREGGASVVAEAAAPGARIVYIRMSTTNREVDTDNWHCGSFQRERAGWIAAKSDDVSEVFRFQPEGETDLTRDWEPNTVRMPPPPTTPLKQAAPPKGGG